MPIKSLPLDMPKTLPFPEAEQGFLDKTFESAKRGQEQYKASLAVYESLINPEVEREGALNYWRRVRGQQVLDPIEDNWATNIIYANARTAGQMWETTKRGGKAGLISAGIGAAAGAVVGAVTPTVGEEGLTTSTGAIIGLKAAGKLGLVAGSAIASYREGVGSMYAEMIQQGVDPEISEKVAKVAGLPYALLEVAQLKALAPNLKSGVKEILEKKTASLLATAAKKYGTTLSKEVLEEMAQEVTQIGAEDIAKYLDKQGVPIDSEYLKERINRIWEVAKESTKSFALLPVPGTVIDTGISWAAPITKEELAPIDAEIEAKAEEMKVPKDYVIGSIQTYKEAEKIRSRFPQKIKNQSSLEEVGNAIKDHLGMQDWDIKWELISDRNVETEVKIKDGPTFHFPKLGTALADTITAKDLVKQFGISEEDITKLSLDKLAVIRVLEPTGKLFSTTEFRSNRAFAGIGDRKAGEALRHTQAFVKRGIVHELGHLTKPPATKEGHHISHTPEFAAWVNEKVEELFVRESKVSPVSETQFADYEFAIAQDIIDTQGPLQQAQLEMEITPEDVTSPLSKITIALDKSIKNFAQQESIRKKERGQRFGAMEKAAQGAKPVNVYKTTTGSRRGISEEEVSYNKSTGEYTDKVTGDPVILDQEASRSALEADWKIAAKRELKGEYTKLNIDPLQETVPIENYIKLHEELRTTKKIPRIEAVKLDDALEALFKEGKIFRPHEIKYARKVWGDNFANSLEELSEASKDMKEHWTDYLNLPRATSASLDLSRTARQNVLMLGSPKQWFKALVRDWHLLLRDEKTAKLVEKDYLLKLDKAGDLLNRSGIRWNKWGPGVGYKSGTERFASKFAGKIPGIARSERAYAMGGNALRAEKVLEIAEQRSGLTTTDKQWKDIGHVLNLLTGEGDPKTFGQLAPTLNAIFFAPRLLESRIRAFADLFRPNLSMTARKILAYHVASFVGINAGILALSSMVPGANVETDHRSTDFGKIKFGNTRVDFWGGYLPIARLGIRMATGEIKTQSGRVIPAETRDTIASFLQSKLGPVPAFLLDLYRGQTFYGDYVGVEAESLAQQFYNRFTPFVIQDIMDAIHYQGLTTGVVGGALAFHGVGVQTYPMSKGTEVMMQKDSLASKVLGQKWDELGPEVQKYMKDNFPQIEQMERQAAFDSNNFKFLERMAREKAKVQDKFLNALPKDVQAEMSSLNLKPSGINRTISSDWFLNDKRYKMYELSTIIAYKKVLPKLIRAKWWNRVPPEVKVAILSETMNRIKQAVRENIVASANIKDIQRMKR